MRIVNTIITLKLPKKFDFLLQLTVLILIAFGTLMIISTNVGNTATDPYILPKVILKQVVFVFISYFLMTFLANNFTMHRGKKLIPYVGIVVFIALLATQFSPAVYGSRAWIRIPLPSTQITIQPSEFAKVFMIVAIGVYVEVVGKRNIRFWRIVRVPVIFFVGFTIAVGLQSDLGGNAVLSMITVVCFLIPSHINLRKAQRIVKCMLAIGLVVSLFAISQSGLKVIKNLPFVGHVGIRIENAIDPFTDPYQKGYQPINGLYGIARGGLKGVGLGNSIQKYGYLTQSDNDYILSIIVEELGLFGLSVVVLGYLVIIQRLFYYAFHTKSEGYKVILIGTAMYIFIHFTLNVGGISGLIPLTGVPLLFISSGGSSLMAIMCAIGISQGVISRIRRQGISSPKSAIATRPMTAQIKKRTPRG